MKAILDAMLSLALGLVGLWAGFAIPFLFFVSIGVRLACLVLASLAISVYVAVINERRSSTAIRPWLRGLVVGSAAGAVLQFAFVLAGFWSRFLE